MIMLRVRVIPGAKREGVVEDSVDLLGERFLKVKTMQPPEEGKANQGVMKILADYFHVKVRLIHLVSGQTSRDKVFKIETEKAQ